MLHYFLIIIEVEKLQTELEKEKTLRVEKEKKQVNSFAALSEEVLSLR